MGCYVTFTTKIVTSSPQECGAFIRGEISEPPTGFFGACMSLPLRGHYLFDEVIPGDFY